MSTKHKRCPACEKGTVTPIPTQTPMPYRHVTALRPAWPVNVPTCDQCREQFINTATARSLDAALEAALQSRQTQLLSDAIERLGTVRTQRQWEKRLGLSPGYLSRLKTGKDGSVVLTTLLGLLGQAPARQWRQVEDLWSEHEPSTGEVVDFARAQATTKTVHLPQVLAAQTTAVTSSHLDLAERSDFDFALEAA